MSESDTEQCPVCGWEGVVATKVVDGTPFYSHLEHSGGRVITRGTCEKSIHTGRSVEADTERENSTGTEGGDSSR